MKPIDTLEEAIKKKEAEHAEANKAFRESITRTVESVRPSTIVGRMIRHDKEEEGEDQKIKPVDSAIGLASGFITKKLLLGATHNPLLKLAGYLVQVGVTELVRRNPEQVKQAGNKLVQLFSRKKKDQQTEDHPDV